MTESSEVEAEGSPSGLQLLLVGRKCVQVTSRAHPNRGPSAEHTSGSSNMCQLGKGAKEVYSC